MAANRVEVIGYHGKQCIESRTNFIGVEYANAWLEKHYKRSPYNHARIGGHLCFTMDQADKQLYLIKKSLTR